MDIQLKKINNVEVEALNIKQPPKKFKGKELFSEIYANIFLCAKKKKGKTFVISTILTLTEKIRR